MSEHSLSTRMTIADERAQVQLECSCGDLEGSIATQRASAERITGLAQALFQAHASQADGHTVGVCRRCGATLPLINGVWVPDHLVPSGLHRCWGGKLRAREAADV